jgi:ferritin-like metal-binding protein YciE
MAQIIDLKDLLKHEILDLYSAEEQIIEALPKMVEKASNSELKKALKDHLKVTGQQKDRLDEIKRVMVDGSNGDGSENKGFFSKLFGGSGAEKCKGTEGLIDEGEKMMGEDMSPEVMDAAIIGSAQKIEHYEISGYGTAVAYAKELGLTNVERLLQQTLDEEYAADDLLTKLAVSKLNIKAEDGSFSSKSGSKAPSRKVASASKGDAAKTAGKLKTSPSKTASKATRSRVSSSKSNTSKSSKSSGNKSARKSVTKAASKSGGKSSSKSSNKSGKRKTSAKR